MIVKNYEKQKFDFVKLVEDLYQAKDLSELHLIDPELCGSKKLEQKNEAETYFHKVFYDKLKNWDEIKKVYEDFIKEVIAPQFSKSFLYQAFPSFRVQVPNQTAVSKWHYDNDEDHGHPEWEINFQIPLTKCYDTNCTWIESVPGLEDYRPIEMSVGEYAIFNGNRCRHGNKSNTTGKTRVSFDFRVLPYNRYNKEEKKFSFYGKEFAPGEYYTLFNKE